MIRFLLFIKDTEDPVFTSCPVSFITYAPAGSPIIVNFPAWTNPTYSDNTDQIHIDLSPLTALTMGLQLGTTTITYTASDAAGNQAFCIFDFTLLGEYNLFHCVPVIYQTPFTAHFCDPLCENESDVAQCVIV